MAETPEKKPDLKERKTLRQLKRYGLDHDIRYRGPLSYRWLRAIAWLCFAVAAALILIRLDIKLIPAAEKRMGNLPNTLSSIAEMALPMFLVSNFALILNHQDSYKKQLVKFGLFALGIFIVFLIFYEHYLMGVAGILTDDRREAEHYLIEAFRLLSRGKGILAFNVFIDLFLCTAFLCLMIIQPKRIFTGKKVLILRFLALLPIAYEVLSILARILVSFGRIELPLWTFPLLTTKPPMTFLAFIILVFHIKFREQRFHKITGGTHEQYLQFVNTNKNSLSFSVTAAVTFLVCGIIDLLVIIVMTLGFASQDELLAGEFGNLLMKVNSWGFGDSMCLIPMAPIMLLFSYTRTHKKSLFDMIIPLAGILLIVIVVIEGSYEILLSVSREYGNITDIVRDTLRAIFQALSGE